MNNRGFKLLHKDDLVAQLAALHRAVSANADDERRQRGYRAALEDVAILIGRWWEFCQVVGEGEGAELGDKKSIMNGE